MITQQHGWTAPALEQCRILVVEDDPTARVVITALLAHEGHAVQAARTGEEALRLIKRQAGDPRREIPRRVPPAADVARAEDGISEEFLRLQQEVQAVGEAQRAPPRLAEGVHQHNHSLDAAPVAHPTLPRSSMTARSISAAPSVLEAIRSRHLQRATDQMQERKDQDVLRQ